MGSENILMGSDYPFEMMEVNPVLLVNNIDNISNNEKDKIKGANALRLLKL